MDEKTKENILGTIGVIGVIVAMVTALLLFGPYFEVYLIPIDENLGIWLLTIGITLAVLGLGSAISIARMRVRKLIANFTI